MVEPRSAPPGSGIGSVAQPGVTRRAMLRQVVGGTLAWATAAALLAILAAWFFGDSAGRSASRASERVLHDLAAALAASISPEEAVIARSGEPEPRFERELRAQLLALQRTDRSIRSVVIVGPVTEDGAAPLLLEERSGGPTRGRGDLYHPPPGLSLREAESRVIVATARGAGTLAAFAPVMNERGQVVALAGIEMDGAGIAAAAGARRTQAAALAGVLVLAIAGLAAWRARLGLQQLDLVRGLRAKVAIYRVGDALASAESDGELVRLALEAIASGSGIERWAIYLRQSPGEPAQLFASRGFPPGVAPTSEPLPASPSIVSTPLVDGAETIGLLQCELPPGRIAEAEEHALIRWMAAQVSVGLKRIRMERRNQMLALFTMGTGEILLGIAPDGTIRYANEAAERALGAARGGLAGRPLDAVAGWGAGDSCEAVSDGDGTGLLGALGGEREFAGEVCFLRADGSRFPAEVRITPAVDRQGRLLALVLLGHDVTERREREAQLENRTRELGLLNDQLQRAVGELEEARRAQSEFVANTSHELRTPLNAVIGFASLIEQKSYESEDEAQDFAKRIRTSAEHLLGLLNDILDLAKVEAGRFQLSMTVADIRDPIRQAMDGVVALAASKGLRLEADLPDRPIEARIDLIRTRQVVLNLLGNALKYTDTGEVRVRAWADLTGEVRVAITDTGIGISKEGQRRLFSKFGRVDLSLAGRRSGTGLGLAISKALIQGMGGTITVESDGLGSGTRATVTFPPAAAEPALP